MIDKADAGTAPHHACSAQAKQDVQMSDVERRQAVAALPGRKARLLTVLIRGAAHLQA